MKHGKGIAFNRSMVKRQITRKKAVEMADRAFSLYIRARDGNKCYCGRILNQPMQCCHLFSRVNFSTRWSEEWAFCGHSGCNYENEFNPHKMINWYISKFGLERYEAGFQKSQSTLKLSTLEIVILARYYQEKLVSIKGGEL